MGLHDLVAEQLSMCREGCKGRGVVFRVENAKEFIQQLTGSLGQQTTGHATKVRWLRDGEMEEERCREMGAIATFSVGVKTGLKLSEATDNRQ